MFAVGGGIDRRCIAALEVEKPLAKEGELGRSWRRVMNFLQFLLVELIITGVDTGLLWCSVIISRRPRVFCVCSAPQVPL